MKAKVFLTSVLMLCTLLQARGENTDLSTLDNVVYMQPATFSAGSQQTLSIRMKNTVGIQTVQFDIVLPEGITVAKDEDDFELISLSTERTTVKKMDAFSPAKVSDGRYRLLINSTKGYTFDGTDGEICTILVKIDNTITQGIHPIVFEDIVLVDANSNGFETPRVECSITIEGVDDGRLKFYETSTSLPSYTAGDKADVTVYRDIKANEWSTLVLPFNLSQANAKAVFGNDVQLAQFSGFEVDYGADDSNVIPLSITIQLTSYSIPAREPLAGGTPILIKTSKDISEIKFDNVTLTEGVTAIDKADQYNTSGILTGSLTKTTVPADGLFINDNKFWYSTGNTQIKGFRCWFELGAVLNKATDFGAPVFFEIDGNVTGIKNIQKYTKDDDRYYNLSGQRVENPTKGLYIKNGKKVVVK